MHQPIVTQDKRDVDAEHLLLLGDWYHRTAEEALEFYMQPGSFGKEPVPDSLLLNGFGAFNCSDAVPASGAFLFICRMWSATETDATSCVS